MICHKSFKKSPNARSWSTSISVGTPFEDRVGLIKEYKLLLTLRRDQYRRALQTWLSSLSWMYAMSLIHHNRRSYALNFTTSGSTKSNFVKYWDPYRKTQISGQSTLVFCREMSSSCYRKCWTWASRRKFGRRNQRLTDTQRSRLTHKVLYSIWGCWRTVKKLFHSEILFWHLAPTNRPSLSSWIETAATQNSYSIQRAQYMDS